MYGTNFRAFSTMRKKKFCITFYLLYLHISDVSSYNKILIVQFMFKDPLLNIL